MRFPSTKPSALLAAAALTTLTTAHSWVEEVYRIAPNGTLVGDAGYPRGWVARTSTDPLWKDAIPQWLLPLSGQSAYSGEEKLNKYDFVADPKFAMLQAAPGDHISLIHLENGHTTLPQNQPKKPHNRGTIFLYGTDQPKPQERLFDVHLVWNRDGTGGDKRGRLLATRNYDDGQCYQPNPGEISTQRAKELAAEGAVHDRELRCQSDIQLPADLKPGSTYTIYWYWDWPDLNAGKINMDATKDGKYPWAGTFMRGEKDPNGFDMAAIAKNESYASTVDIKIVDAAKLPGGAVAKAVVGGAVDVAAVWNSQQNIYTKAIKAQMTGNFQVDIDANQPAGGSGGSNAPSATSTAPASAPPSSGAGARPSVPPSSDPSAPPDSTPTTPPGDATVTVTVTVPPSTIIQTVYSPKSTADGVAPSQPAMPPAESNSMSQPSQPPPSASNSNSMSQPSQPPPPASNSNSMSQPSQPPPSVSNSNSMPQPSQPPPSASDNNSMPQPSQPPVYYTGMAARGSASSAPTTWITHNVWKTVTSAVTVTLYDGTVSAPASGSTGSATAPPTYARRGRAWRHNWQFGQ
ncbi:hypothetical protein LMH87_006088 [Akanthomyces muscarius]|uniref:DUF7492 domain-containing protein n=1 Tax=Akanthomyces muscarius TaxID=2231603 RepID=A0A9W8QQ84_AKAMU|nr:hypothetical protein LMH87_006088 [Akanthomyces muscarius]KAJ4164412.1 hypothetical protein LMH87_006088 [Akanthomyces muscarius]